jgi:hypothetical protein
MKLAGNGRKYKEFICESYGVRQVTECLSKSRSDVTQDYAKNLLISLGTVIFSLLREIQDFKFKYSKAFSHCSAHLL